MADEYTPTTTEMGDAYTQMRVREAKGETGTERIWTAIDALAEFQRGLAAHDAGVRKAERERIAQEIEEATEPDEADSAPHLWVRGMNDAGRIARGATR